MGDEMITKFALHEKQSVKTTFIFNKSQNLAHSMFDKLHKLRYAQNEHLKASYN
jgi:hypothetical protein